MAPKKKIAPVQKAIQSILTPQETIEVVSSGTLSVSYTKGVTISKNYNSVRHEFGIEVIVPTNELKRATQAMYDYVDSQLNLLTADKPEVTSIPSTPKLDQVEAGDSLDIQLTATAETNLPASAGKTLEETKSLAETLDAELDSLTGEAPIEEGEIPDEF
jgi:hypothetical protein